jgi:hypothetical protein
VRCSVLVGPSLPFKESKRATFDNEKGSEPPSADGSEPLDPVTQLNADQWNCSSSVEPVSAVTLDLPP